jgi:CxxC motif-containing protein (DUF1111 family)
MTSDTVDEKVSAVSENSIRRWLPALGVLALIGIAVVAVSILRSDNTEPGNPHGPIAVGVTAALGEPSPLATPEQLEAFFRGREVALRRFGIEDGLGPAFNVTFCSACHERPVPGGSAGLYRNFFLAGTSLSDGSFVPAESAGEAGGVIRMYAYGDDQPARPTFADDVNVVAQRNPIPFFGVGLLAEIPEIEILSRADPDDDDGDGISGRPNWDRGFVGRFGRKAQTVSIEGFLRGPMFNHLGITSDPLSEEDKARLPVDSSVAVTTAGFGFFRQAAAPDGPLIDFDGVADPELSNDDLFDLVSYAMLLAAPAPEPATEQTTRGAGVFDDIGCGSCHTPRLESARGPLPVYSDLLLHDMGSDLADGIAQGDATGSEYRTQPLWGLAAVGPYLHDGRATSITEAILAHGGESERARNLAAALDPQDMADLVAFLESLGGANQYTPGLVPPGQPLVAAGELGGPRPGLDDSQLQDFAAGRDAFDRDFGFGDGVGAPGFNGDSCRACHFDPIIGGSGPSGVNVMRHGSLGSDGIFEAPQIGTILPKQSADSWLITLAGPDITVFEHRQTPSLFGLGLIDELDEAAIRANADPDDLDNDGISGVVAVMADGRVGRFGWKAQVPSLAEFVRDALGAEMGMTLDPSNTLTFGITGDADPAADPEFSAIDAETMLFYLSQLAPPPRQGDLSDPVVAEGEALFAAVGCAECHTPQLDGPDGPVALYSDLLLHDVLPAGTPGIADGTAGPSEFRTAPLWGIALTGPYLHDGSQASLDGAIRGHDGEAARSRDTYSALSDDERTALVRFLESL